MNLDSIFCQAPILQFFGEMVKSSINPAYRFDFNVCWTFEYSDTLYLSSTRTTFLILVRKKDATSAQRST